MPLKQPTGAEVYEFKKSNPSLSWPDLSEHYGISVSTLRTRSRSHRKKHGLSPIGRQSQTDKDERPSETPTHKIKFTEERFAASAYSVSDRIKTLDQLLAACDADLTKWRVKKYMVNVWEMGRKKKVADIEWNDGVMNGFVEDTGDWQLTDLWQVKAWFEPREEEPYEAALTALIEKVKDHAPTYKPSFLPKEISDGYLLVPNLYDAHFGKRSRTSGYTVDHARDDYVRIAEIVAAQATSGAKTISRIMFPIGHDILHVDNLKDTTTHGTWVESSVDIREAINAACVATTKAIEIFATVAPVDVIPVEGNHDRLQTYWLTKYLQAFFSNHPTVTVCDLTLERQYYQWGRVGLGLTHQAKKPHELATIFPVEARQMWADIEWSEWLTGHFHKERGALYAVDSVRGTVIRTIPALCDVDNYHSLHMFVGGHRAAEVMYYHKENGPAGIFPVFVSEL